MCVMYAFFFRFALAHLLLKIMDHQFGQYMCRILYANDELFNTQKLRILPWMRSHTHTHTRNVQQQTQVRARFIIILCVCVAVRLCPQHGDPCKYVCVCMCALFITLQLVERSIVAILASTIKRPSGVSFRRTVRYTFDRKSPRNKSANLSHHRVAATCPRRIRLPLGGRRVTVTAAVRRTR